MLQIWMPIRLALRRYTMLRPLGAGLVLTAIACTLRAADLADLPANTWVEIKYTTEQPADPGAAGRWLGAGRLEQARLRPGRPARPLLRSLGGQEAWRIHDLRQLLVRL
jgi:hypothetical protein